jgi:hypothetical protein
MTTKTERYTSRAVPDNESRDWDDTFGELPTTFGIDLRANRDWDVEGHDLKDTGLSPREIAQRYYVLKVYFYIHGGIALRAFSPDEVVGYPFNDEWDAGPVGHVYISKKEATVEHIGGIKRQMTIPQKIQKASNYLKKMTTLTGEWLNGEFWGFEVIDTQDDDNVVDSCWGYLGAHGMDNAKLEGLACAKEHNAELAEQWAQAPGGE